MSSPSSQTAPRWRALFLAGCFAVLAAPLALVPFHFDRDAFGANARTAHPFPRLGRSWQTAADFPAAFDAFYAEHFRLRGFYMRLFAFDTWHAFGISPSSKVLVGRGGWLYYDAQDDNDPIATYQGTNLLPAADLAKARAALAAWRDWFQARGIVFLVCVAPEKTTVYPEYLPEGYATRNHRTRIDQFIEACAGPDGVEVVDLRAPLQAAKRSGEPPFPLYYRTDTHWNAAGAFVGSQALLRAVAAHFPAVRPPAAADYEAVLAPGPTGDLARMIGVGTGLKDWDPAYRPRFASAVTLTRFDRKGGVFIAEQPRPALPRAVVFRDSFTGAMIPFLSEAFRRAVYLSDPQPDPRCIELERPDVVILEMVERYVSRAVDLAPPEEMLRLYPKAFYP